MTDNSNQDDTARFATTFTRAIIAWNQVEDTARSLLKGFGTSSFSLTVAVDHLSGRSLKEALLTVCDAMTDPEKAPSATVTADHVTHFVNGMDILRGYRNFYVHSLKAIGHSLDDQSAFRGTLMATEAKGRYAFISQELPTEDLEAFMADVSALQHYGAEILETFPNKNTSALSALLPDAKRRPVPSLQKPTWPKPVTKRRDYLTER
jgi:hypothetical protein